MQPALPACDDETLSTEGSFMQRRLFNQAIVASLVSPWLATGALAQTDYPNKPIRLIITHAAGGLPDTVARIYAQRLTTKLGISVLVDNKPGANGQLAAQAVSSSPADGYTFLVTDGSTFSINPRLYKSQNFDANKDFVPVSLLVRAPMFLAVQSSLGVNTLQELIALAKSKPGVLNYGSSGIGSTHHLCHETMNNALGLDILHVPFRGTAQSIPALVGGQVQLVFSAMPSLAGFVKGGQLKLLAVNSAQRSPLAPELPAVGELVPGFDFSPKIGLFADKNTPASVINRISTELAAVAKMPEMIAVMNNGGMDPVGSTPGDYAKAITSENERFAKAITAAGIKPE
jgi:tripartite-type tricarboxylate transporter receptor subunit TctC